MFRPGELIFYGRTGVCRVEGLEEIGGRQYYCLRSVYQSCTIHTPVNGKVPMRPLLTCAEANALIDRIPDIVPEPTDSRVLRELTERYLSSVNSCDAEELLTLTMSIYAKKQQAIRDGKKLGSIDARFLREGEALLFGELAIALGIAPEKVPEHIRARLAESRPR